MDIRLPDGRTLTLSAQQFVAAGGEAEVFAWGSEAFKIYSDVQRVPSQDKLDALAAIQHANVLVPRVRVMDAQSCEVVGVMMPYLGDAAPLCAYTTASSWAQHGVVPAQRMGWVASLRKQVVSVHAAGALVVDLSLMNVLVSHSLQEVYLIDVDSYAVDGFPPTAQSESIRDRTVPRGSVSKETDWFAFAVVAFQVMTGIHPYRGYHPTLKTLDARMNAQVSVFDASVQVPHVAASFTSIPDQWLDWFRQVFTSGYREQPPEDSVYVVVPRPVPNLKTSETVKVHLLGEYVSPVLDACMWDSSLIVRTEEGVFLGQRRVCDGPTGRVAFGLAGPGVPVIAFVEHGLVRCTELASGYTHCLSLEATEVASSDSRVYARAGGTLLELQWFRGPKGWWVVPKTVTQAHPLTARLHHGVLIQRLLGATYASLLTERGRAIQCRLPQLDGLDVLEARYQEGVLFARVLEAEDVTIWVFRTTNMQAISGWKSEKVCLNFTVLGARVVVSEGDMGTLELFNVSADSSASRTVDIPGIHACGPLFDVGQGVGMIVGSQVLRLKMLTA